MVPEGFVRSAMLMFVLLNPFFMSIYLLDPMQRMQWQPFSVLLLRGAAISTVVFIVFAVFGDAVFGVLQVRFASFRIFGGLVFLILAVRFLFVGPKALGELRGDPQPTPGAIAMPFMIGPATISASVVAGARMHILPAALSIALGVVAGALTLIALKRGYDLIQDRYTQAVSRYVDITGRIMAFVTGTIAIEMILLGAESWLERLP